MKADHILIKFINKILRLREPDFDDHDTFQSSAQEQPDKDTDSTSDQNDGANPPGGNNANVPTQVQKDFEKGSYHNILIFLWATFTNNTETKPTNLNFCFKQTTMEWTEEMYKFHLNTGNGPNIIYHGQH